MSKIKKNEQLQEPFYNRVITALLVAQFIYVNTPMYLGTSEGQKMFQDAANFTDEMQRYFKKHYGIEKISIETKLVQEKWSEIKKILEIV